MNILALLKHIKEEYEKTIETAMLNGKKYSNGNEAKEAFIRSQILINYIHEYVKREFIRLGVSPKKIFPPKDASKPEIKIDGFLKSKNQDICIVPDHTNINSSDVLSVNIRSQLSSLQKNIDTLYERTFAEALNLHLKNPDQILGEVYLIPTHEYDDKSMIFNEVRFKNVGKLEDYINKFQQVNNRTDIKKDEFKYERACLLIVDFRKEDPKLYSTTKSLIDDGLIPKETKSRLEGLSIETFASDLLEIYDKRFGLKKIT